MTMKLSVHMFVLVCAITYVKCMTDVSTTIIKSTTKPQPASTSKTAPTAAIPPTATNASTANPSTLTSTTAVTTSSDSADIGLGNGSQQLIKPLSPLIFGAIAVFLYFL